MKLHLLPVYSKLASPELLARVLRGRTIPAGYELREHQALTLAALEDPDIDIVTNLAMTGDGKSLAAYLQSLIGLAPGDIAPRSVLAIYPTIELLKDQERQFANYQERFGSSLLWTSLWGAKLTELAGQGFGVRANALISLLNTHNIVLTNPDIFSRIMNFQYLAGIYTRQELPWTATTLFHLWIFDEFHIFSMPQFVSAITALIYAQETAGKFRPKALFSSATQHHELLQLIERAGLRQQHITGSYVMSPTTGYRQILHEADLNIHQLTGEQNIESWVREHVHIIEDAWRSRNEQEPRVAIIVSSVATARRLTDFLGNYFATSAFKPGGLCVAEVSGLTHSTLDVDIVVGTSTVDVGVDFHVNLLIFEALNAGQFLQRLGRLGRYHSDKGAFADYTAHVLISVKTPWISQTIAQKMLEQGIQDGDSVDRPDTLRPIIEASYPEGTAFVSYGRRWGALQGYHVVNMLRYGLKERGEQSAYTADAESMEPRLAQVFDWKDLRVIGWRYRLLARDEPEGVALLDEVLSFRGSSPFQVALWDAARGAQTAEQFTPYDLFFVLQSTRWQLIPEQDFLRALHASLASTLTAEQYQLREREFDWVMQDTKEQRLCLRILDFLDERERILLSLERYVEDDGLLDRPVAIKGFRVEEPRTGGALSQINDSFVKRVRAVCYITRKPIPELRRLRLPALFPLYKLQVRGMPDFCTVTFGKSALMLDALTRSRRNPRSRQGFSSDDRPQII